jgi:uncharacterized protein YkwD
MNNFIQRAIITVAVLFSFAQVDAQQTASTQKFRREFLEYINSVRAKGCTCGITYMAPAPPLTWNVQLELSAMGHAADMANQNYFSHTSLDGRTMQGRIRAAGYTYDGFKNYMIGENIAYGPPTISEVMQGWFKSPGHCKNLMNPEFKEIGVAEDRTYWVQDFGGREAFSAETQRMIKSGRYHIVERQ